MNTVRGVGGWAFLIALFYGFRAAMGVRAFDDWFGPYVKLGLLIWNNLPDWNHPVLLVIAGAFLLLVLSQWIRHTRSIASAIVALFLVRLGFALAGEGTVPPPDMWLGAAAVLAFGWLLFSASFGDPRLWTWIRSRSSL